MTAMRFRRAGLIGIFLVSIAVAAIPVAANFANLPGKVQRDGSMLIPNGDRIRPAGRLRIPLHGDMPLALIPGVSGKRFYTVTGGYHDHGISSVDLRDEVIDTYGATTKCTGGLVETADGTGYFTAGDLGIRQFRMSWDKDIWTPIGFKFSERAWIQGLALLPDGNLIATDINNDLLICLDPKTLATKWTTKVGHKPSRIAINATTGTIAVTNWGGASLSIVSFDGTRKPDIAVGIHPSELVQAKDGTLFVTNAGSNTVSVIRNGAVAATVFTSLTPNDIVGSTPTGLSLSPDQKTLYVANSGSNNVAKLDVSDPNNPSVKGFIPTGWYPSTVLAAADGKRLVIGTAKGLETSGNYPGIREEQTLTDDLRNHYDYLPTRLEGDLMVLDLPDDKTLAKLTATCRKNAEREMSAAMLEREKKVLPALKKIKHVVYIIRENRTYDQVLGDLPGTNAEPKLCMYGENITPNGHKIAKTFKTFDNLYCDGEVSQDGHQWCCASYATDFNEKAWPTGYAGRGRADDDESVNSSPGGYLWDNCKKHGLSYRSYGEFASFSSDKDSAPKFNGESGLEGHASLEWSQSDARDKDKVDIFINDMRKSEAKNDWPRFMVMSLGEDHTSGRSPGAFTPFANVASNDVGLGKIVDAVSHSKYWAETAIFVIQDDAQDGPDHVDGHRTVGYVISPYVRRGGKDSTMYSTASMVRTMELILGLPPMSQHDRHATSMVGVFTEKPNLSPFTFEKARIDLSARNPKSGELAEASLKLDFSEYDRVNPDAFNRILWADAKPGVPYPRASHLSR
jgi:YVTN family beta-propeller protein